MSNYKDKGRRGKTDDEFIDVEVEEEEEEVEEEEEEEEEEEDDDDDDRDNGEESENDSVKEMEMEEDEEGEGDEEDDEEVGEVGEEGEREGEVGEEGEREEEGGEEGKNRIKKDQNETKVKKENDLPMFGGKIPYDSDEEEEEEEDINYFQKFTSFTKKNIVTDFHPEIKLHNEEEIEFLSCVIRNNEGVIIDKYHTTIPFLTKYEKTRIIGERARQINLGAIPFIEVKPDIIDGYLIALEEFYEKKIPFIIKRPLPNGLCEYWKIADLEII